jgi:outer membrane protein
MKKIILSIVAAICMIANATAQNIKIGYVNSDELLSIMPESIVANKSLEALAKTYEDQLVKMQNEYKTKIADYQKDYKTLDPAIKEVKEGEIADIEKRMTDLRNSAQEKLQAKKDELFMPIITKADKAVKDVAKENGFTYVFDATNSGLIVAPEGDNILPLIKAKLNIKDTPATGGVKPVTGGATKPPVKQPAPKN